MFSSFFPTPRFFFPAALIWTALSMALWYGFARDLGPELSLGGLIGFERTYHGRAAGFRKLAAADRDGSMRDLIVAEPGVGYRVAEAPD